MSNRKLWLIVGGSMLGTGVITFFGNLLIMYGLVGQCSPDLPCLAFEVSLLISNISYGALAIGLAVFIVGLVKDYKSRHDNH